uniref:ATP synthase complex subunit 8 n=1 Tax=Sympiezomias velatus TaxID=2044628 RepID=A0A343L6P9_9CUCU|nr:ATP synthase F0 subunit 8 [Sympiezomias velatus]
MPQMAPLNWMSMYLFFILIFVMFIIVNYYSFLYKPKTMKFSNLKKLLSWKW